MKSKMMLMVLIFTTALAIYVAAQSKATKGPVHWDMHLYRQWEAGLCAGPLAGENRGNTSGVRYEPLPSVAWAGKLLIEMQDGAIQEIDLKNVKKMTVRDR